MKTLFFLPVLLMASQPSFSTVLSEPAPLMEKKYLGECDAERFESLIGKHESSLDPNHQLAVPVRFIRVGHAYTMEYVARRINFHLDEQGHVVRLSCG